MATLEYTDAPSRESSDQPTPTAETGLLESAEGHASDLVALALSVIPGLGHVYKGYRVMGLALMFLGTPMALGIALLVATFTAGFGAFSFVLYWGAVAIHAWAIPDRVAPATGDESEEY